MVQAINNSTSFANSHTAAPFHASSTCAHAKEEFPTPQILGLNGWIMSCSRTEWMDYNLNVYA